MADGTVEKKGITGITRREFVIGAALTGAAVTIGGWGRPLIEVVEEVLKKSAEGPASEILIPVEQDGIKINLIKYTSPLSYRILESEASAKLPSHSFSAQYRVGALGEDIDKLFLDQGVFLVHQKDDKQEARWNDSEAKMIAKALIRARVVNGKFFNYEEPGIGYQVRHVNKLFLKKESNWLFHPQASMSFVPLPVEDIVHIKASLESRVEPSDDLFGEVVTEYNHHLNNLVDIWLESREGQEKPFIPALVEGMGAYADSLATGRWRLTGLSKERLEQQLKADESFYGTKMQDNITLTGMVIAEAEKNYPGIWAYMNHKLFIEAVERYGGGTAGKDKIFEMLLKGDHPVVPLDTYLKFGDEFTKEEPVFSTWFKQQKLFFIHS